MPTASGKAVSLSQIATLEEVVEHYARSPAAPVGHSELAQRGAGHAAQVLQGRWPTHVVNPQVAPRQPLQL